ncbi:ABC transporter ATP-binding protein/permease [Paenibacillus sp. N4]|uniref:ABC transporter ATP-binding protein n=1 Tax=Paenibacillus vietnamensis TaxID=2590547 RepID=UPI001CD068C8|nr:ABC transporter ATP-binding protein [Paenibacillus vietnamensis]MCA0756743.1 ABC transporter ATP-binding protein/permease [Paenibacillus vietnamensis]
MIGLLKSRLSVGVIRNAYTLLAPYIIKRRKAYVGLFILVGVEIGLMLAFAWFLGQITDAAVQQQFDRLYGLAPFGACLSVLTIVSDFTSRRLAFTATNGVKKDLSERLLKHIMHLPASRTDQLHSGELMTHFNQDVHGINGLIGSSLIQWVRLPLVFAAVFVYMLQIHWLMAVMGLMIVPFALGAGALLGFVLRRRAREIQDLYGSMNSLLSDTLQGLSVIRSFTAESAWLRKYADKNGELYHLQQKYVILQGWIGAGGQAAGASILMVSLCLGAYFVSHHMITVGSLLAFVNLSGHLLYPLTGMAGLWIGIQQSSAAADRIAQVLQEPLELYDSPPAVLSVPDKKTIEFRNISFRYEGQASLIERFSLICPAGQTVAIVGASGAGKSTLFHLLQGFYKPQAGSIYINGESIDRIGLPEIRSSISLVSQETFLFSGTIRDNLLIARPEATEQEIHRAAIHASIHDYILSLPNGYDSQIGERGILLSGGQRQRIAIARAVLKDAPILLLDEATASLDSETEYLVKQSLDRLMFKRTTLIIAHRLSTIQHADMIVVMDKGVIVQIGTHEELSLRPGMYRKLKRRQTIEDRRGYG